MPIKAQPEIGRKALWGKQMIDHYNEISSQPAVEPHYVIGVIVRDLLHFALIHGMSPEEASTAVSAGFYMQMLDLTAIQKERVTNPNVEDPRTRFLQLVKELDNPTVPAGMEKFMPSAKGDTK